MLNAGEDGVKQVYRIHRIIGSSSDICSGLILNLKYGPRVTSLKTVRRESEVSTTELHQLAKG